MSYRSDRDALETRREALETDLRALRAKAGELSELDAQIRETQRALEELQQRMLAPEAVRRLPLIDLDQLRVASPCTADWDRMEGDDRMRFCGDCKLHVFNLSAMTRPEAEALLRERTGRTCVRFYRRADGTVLTADCPVGARKKRVRRAVLAVAGAGAMTVAAVAGMVSLRLKRETCAMRQPNTMNTIVEHTVGGYVPPPQAPSSPGTPPSFDGPTMGDVAAPDPLPRRHMMGVTRLPPSTRAHPPVARPGAR